MTIPKAEDWRTLGEFCTVMAQMVDAATTGHWEAFDMLSDRQAELERKLRRIQRRWTRERQKRRPGTK